MNKFIEVEGQQRRKLGLYDEMYVLELFTVKEKLKSEYEKRIERLGSSRAVKRRKIENEQ